MGQWRFYMSHGKTVGGLSPGMTWVSFEEILPRGKLMNRGSNGGAQGIQRRSSLCVIFPDTRGGVSMFDSCHFHPMEVRSGVQWLFEVEKLSLFSGLGMAHGH